MNKNVDAKLIQNVVDEINRLNEQLNDLETYKSDFSQEEIDSTKKETLEQLIETTKRLEKMKKGDLTTKTELEEAQAKLNQVLIDNFHVKDLVNSYLATEVVFLREKLNSIIRMHTLNKISQEEFNSSMIQILEIIAKNTQLNQEEQKMYDSLKKKNMTQYQEDKGIDKTKIEKNISQK